MNFSYYIGRKLTLGKEKSFTRFIIRLAIVGVALSLSVMMVAVAVVDGFSYEIKNKIAGFSGHIQVKNLDLNQSDESEPIPFDSTLYSELKKHNNIEYVVPVATKTGILQTDKDIEGLLFKGVPSDYNWDFFDKYLVKGRKIHNTDTSDTYEFIISEKIGLKLGLDTGQMIDVYFIQDEKVRRRRLLLVGFFNTGLEELDQKIIITDLRVIQRIFSPQYNLVSSYEIRIKDTKRLDETSDWVDNEIGLKLKSEPIYSTYYVIFQWLSFVDYNAVIIITLMLFVAIVNCITALLVLIIERTNMVGVLKALGATNKEISRIFLFKGMYLVSIGLIIGNAIAFALAFAQKKWEFLKLDQETYYMNLVPFKLSLEKVLALNIGTFIICLFILLIPTLMIRRINPVKAIRYE